MKNLPDRLNSIGIERRFAVDIGSVISGIRPRGLMHIPVLQKHSLEQLLTQFGLIIEAQRALYRQSDSTSREGILLESCCGDSVTEWWEIWYSHPTAARVNAEKLFLNTGEFLGYPRCCRSSMLHDNALDKLYYQYIFKDNKRFWELNRLATLFHHTILMPDFFPCSLSCEAGRAFVYPFQKISYEIFQQAEVDLAIASMKSALTVVETSLISWNKWKVRSDGVHVAIDDAKKESLQKVSSLCHSQSSKTPSILSFTHLDFLFNRDTIRLHINKNENNLIQDLDCRVV